MRLITTETNTEPRPVHICIYAEPLGGKSLAAAMLSKHMHLVYLDLENRPNTLTDNLTQEELDRIDYYSIPDTTADPIAATLVYNFARNKPIKINGDTLQLSKIPKESCLIIDSGTQLTKSALYTITKGLDLLEGKTEIEFKHYASMEFMFDNIGSAIQAAQCSVVYISHAAPVKTVAGQTKLGPISGTENYSRNFSKYFDETIYLYAENKKYKVLNLKNSTLLAIVGSRCGLDLSLIPHEGYYDLYPLFVPHLYKEFINVKKPETTSSKKKLKL